MAKHFGIGYRAHDALEDAKCAGLIVLRAISDSGLDIDEWLVRVTQPIGSRCDGQSYSFARDGNPDGELYGETIAFTGMLSCPRHEAADFAAAAGCNVEDGVTKHTTLLIVGDQDIRRLAGHEKSSKHRKAERLIENGQAIRILGESDFMRIVSSSVAPN